MPAGFQGFGNAAGFVGSGSFNPSDISNAVAWYRADLGITLNGSNVSAWNDQSGVGDANRNLLQASAGSQPTYVASSANFGGRPTLLANSLDDFLQSGTWSASISQPYTKAVVAIANNAVASAVTTDGGSEGSAYIYEAAGGSSNTWTGFAGTALGSGVSSTSKSAVLVIFNGNSSSIYVNSNTPTNGPIGAANHGTQLTVMNSRDTHSFAVGVELAELVMYSRALTAPEIAALLNYFGTRYGITIT